MDRHGNLGMLFEVAAYAATAALAGRSGGREEEQEAMAPMLGIESLGERLKAGAKVLGPGGCVDRTRAGSHQGHTEEDDRAQW